MTCWRSSSLQYFIQTNELSTLSLLLGGIGVAGLAALNPFNVCQPSLYVVVGVFTWVCVLKSIVHATLAGVAVALAMPLAPDNGQSMVERAEHALKPWVSYAIVRFLLSPMPVCESWTRHHRSSLGQYRLGLSPARSSASGSAFSVPRWLPSKSELRSGLPVLPTSNF